MKRSIPITALLAVLALALPAAASADQRCFKVEPHSGRPTPLQAYALHVYDFNTSWPIYWSHGNSEGWYYVRVYPGGEIAKVLWHDPKQGAWISNFSDREIVACFFVAGPGDPRPDPAPPH